MAETTSVDVVEQARELLSGVLERMGIEATIEAKDDEDRILLDVSCEHVDRVISAEIPPSCSIPTLYSDIHVSNNCFFRSGPRATNGKAALQAGVPDGSLCKGATAIGFEVHGIRFQFS